ncbi:MAG: F0F1 ATP synthase subunit B [Clostridia bacterium]|nr:F0F1 ATP synthase subunit B [Clostridia bacterium]
MQSLEVISVNLWQIVISLANLCILYLILRRFLFKRVHKVLSDRREDLDAQYAAAQQAQEAAREDRRIWEERVSGAEARADEIIREASETARRGSDDILSEARKKAGAIVRQAEEDARLEQRKAQAGIRRELAGVSAELAGKLLGREVTEQDHRRLIDDFIEELGQNEDEAQ